MRGGCPDFYCSGSISAISRLILKTCQKGRGLSPHFTEVEARIQSSCLAKGHLAQKGNAGLAPAIAGSGQQESRKEPRRHSGPQGWAGVPMKGQISLRILLRTQGYRGPSVPSCSISLGPMKAGQYGERACLAAGTQCGAWFQVALHAGSQTSLEISRHSLPGGMWAPSWKPYNLG